MDRREFHEKEKDHWNEPHSTMIITIIKKTVVEKGEAQGRSKIAGARVGYQSAGMRGVTVDSRTEQAP